MEIKPYKEKSNWEDFLENRGEVFGTVAIILAFVALLLLGYFPR